MLKLSLSKKNKINSYLPGQEIYFSAGGFGWETEDEVVNTCRTRIFWVIGFFLFIYSVIIIRVFNVCLVDGIQLHKESISYYRPKKGIISPVKRANITDRNGVVVATNLPTVNLFTNPKKVSNAEVIAKKLSDIFPDISYEDFLIRLTRNSRFVYLKRNISPISINWLAFKDVLQTSFNVSICPAPCTS